MALQSPGVQVTIIDESNYTPSPTGTVPFVVVATAENKLNPSGTVAAYTTAPPSMVTTWLAGIAVAPAAGNAVAKVVPVPIYSNV